MSKFNEFHEKYTETGKLPKKERPVMDLFAPGARYEGPRFKVVDIPLHMCLYCMKNNLIDLRAPKAEYMLNFMPITPDNVQQFSGLGFVVGDVVRHAICKFCKKRMKQDMNSELMVSHNGEMIPQKYLKAAEHVGKIQDNIVMLLRQCSLRSNQTTAGESIKVEVGS